MRATVCFCHGRESGPWGTKIRRLARVAEQYGCRVISTDDRDTQDPEERVGRLLDLAAGLAGPLVLVGSSMGGYVAAAAAARLQPLGLFLLAPAVGLPGYAVSAPAPQACRLTIVHGWDDEIVPPANVQQFAAAHRAVLHLLPDGHLLHDQLDRIERLFSDFLGDCLHKARPAVPPRGLVAAF
ncbi:MAG: alpha/beta fold hydrolase [Deltaproteobacteria bacterium]|nr:MAG: alpha/beta fold hydrolase [Deltaproteobacteria bacterium]